jgi:hypothetical protein
MPKVKRHASAARLRKLWKELKSVSKVARRISYSVAGTYRALGRVGLIKHSR